jgi:hypothetical protein
MLRSLLTLPFLPCIHCAPGSSIQRLMLDTPPLPSPQASHLLDPPKANNYRFQTVVKVGPQALGVLGSKSSGGRKSETFDWICMIFKLAPLHGGCIAWTHYKSRSVVDEGLKGWKECGVFVGRLGKPLYFTESWFDARVSESTTVVPASRFYSTASAPC